ncbi:MAG TPA: LamG-like jellyroll fold domain-containing protein [Sedimentisphaerales bacterium]|nr:LamG-like jellyroll fold domain-containing protein [Sedimentisphaerales bacterium]
MRYAGKDAMQLDGSRSYDPDHSGPLTYAWRQTSGPPLVMAGADTATPTVNGPGRTNERGITIPGSIPQTDDIQECQFELVVSDGELTSLPDAMKLVIVPSYGDNAVALQNPPFDANKPTFIFFGGGDCISGSGGQSWPGLDWVQKANLIWFPSGYSPDIGGNVRTYFKYGDMLIVYLSGVAPDYREPIQTSGWSTGGQPAIDVGLRLNLKYMDPRYAINRVTFFDATPYCRANYLESIRDFLTSSIDGEQCWIDNYVGQNVQAAFPGILNFGSALTHAGVPNWYSTSLTVPDACQFNHGVVAGAYWSVIGPGKNLQLAYTPDQQTYNVTWIGSPTAGVMELSDESLHPGRLLEPVSLGAWVNRFEGSGDVDGAVLSCDECENAVGYQLLFGSDPYRVMDFRVVSDTPFPPADVIRDLPSEETWWTVRARDAYGSTIHADPILLDLASLPSMSVENTRTGRRYVLIGHAIRDAEPGDVILLNPGTYDEHIELAGRILTLRSLDPNDPLVVAATTIRGKDSIPTVAITGPESAGCVLDGLTILGQAVAVSCHDACPRIARCTIAGDGPNAIEFWEGYEPTIVDCDILGEVMQVKDPRILAFWKLDETAGMIAHDSVGGNDATILGVPLWQPEGGMIGGALQLTGVPNFATAKVVRNPSEGPLSVFAWVKGGGPGQVVISQQGGVNWLMADGTTGALMTGLSKTGRKGSELASEAVITDGDWHGIGFTWDGRSRALYVDGVEVAQDTQDSMAGSTGNMTIGAGSSTAPATFWKGLIDEVRIYSRVVRP